MYYVKSWTTGATIKEFDNLPDAKKLAKNLGHTGEDQSILTGYPPIAYVSNENCLYGQVVYNPRFTKKEITCIHPPEKLFSWFAFDDTLVVVCKECHKVIRGEI